MKCSFFQRLLIGGIVFTFLCFTSCQKDNFFKSIPNPTNDVFSPGFTDSPNTVEDFTDKLIVLGPERSNPYAKSVMFQMT